MARVIKLKKERIINCDVCGEYVQYEVKDVRNDHDYPPHNVHWKYVMCPSCKQPIKLD